MKITIFSEELRKCLNAAGLSDCGENDTWNYWYQRLMNAYNESVERQIMTEQTENTKLRELVRDMAECMDNSQPRCKKCKFRELNCQWFKFDDRMHELGVEVEG